MPYNNNEITVGIKTVKPCELLRTVVAITSKKIANNKYKYFMLTLFQLLILFNKNREIMSSTY